MNCNENVFGAKASVYLKFEQDIKSLATKLQEGLIIPSFEVITREAYPHDLVGSSELLGFEVWLESSNLNGCQYHFKIETEHCLTEQVNDRMYDLSLWLARYIAEICDIETLVNVDGELVVFEVKNIL